MKVYNKAVLPIDFKANAVSCGIKKSGKLDLALFYSGIPAKTLCKFTASKIQAAPIQVAKKYLKRNGKMQAIVVNSGNANCFTGKAGINDAEGTAKAVAAALRINKEKVLVSSTGIIGRRLPLSKIKKAVPSLVSGLSREGISRAKVAIRTTDTFTKEITVRFNIGAKPVTICAVAKGAGMIAPNMATMLCFIMTDASITQRALKEALGISVDNSFNCITVDGCMSTNDTVAILANAAAGNIPIDTNMNFKPFLQALNKVCLEVAKMIVRDAEGATKFIRINVSGAKDLKYAKKAALGIANSNLFKTAVYGENPNFGRIVAAVGASGIAVKEKDLKIKVSPLHRRDINVNVSVGRGRGKASVYTSDLTPQYIKINAEYN